MTTLEILALLVAGAARPAAAIQGGACLSLHAKTHTTKSSTICSTWSPNAQGIPCSQYTTKAEVGRPYDVYLVVGHGDPARGIGCVKCILSHSQDVGVYSWDLCADHEMLGDSGGGEWPDAGGTNTITWTLPGDCQRQTVGDEGVHAVVGAFYVYAYSEGTMSVYFPPGNCVLDCNGGGVANSLGSASVDFGGYPLEGPRRNPCLDNCRSLAPQSVDMGTTFCGMVRDSTILIRNASDYTIRGTLSITGPELILVSPTGAFSIDPGGALPVRVRFAPTGCGKTYGALLTGFPCDGGIELTGVGLSPHRFSPPSLSFPEVVTGYADTLGIAMINVSPIVFSGKFKVTGTEFHLGPGPDSFTLQPGDSIATTVVFEPLYRGTRTGTFTAGIACTGASLAGPGLLPCSVTPLPYDMGTVPVGEHLDKDFLLANNLPMKVSGQPVAANNLFTIVAGGEPFDLNHGESHPFTIRFTPPGVHYYTGAVSFGTPCGVMEVWGRGGGPTPSCSVSPANGVIFGLVEVGTSKTNILRLASTGTGALTVLLGDATIASEFTLPNGPGPFTAAPGDTIEVPVCFAPVELGARSSTLETGSPCGEIFLSGYGQRDPVACVIDTETLDFGEVPLDSTGQAEFVLHNYSGRFAGGQMAASCPDFAIVSGFKYGLGWPDSQVVRAQFTPRTVGPQTCTISVQGACTGTVLATGVGIAPPDTARALPRFHAASRPDAPVQQLAYEILEAAHVRIQIFNVAGRPVASFDEGFRPAGGYEVTWDARLRPAGLYFVRITAGRAEATARVLLLR